MKITVTIDRNSIHWDNERERNLLFATAQIQYLEDLYLHTGYLYFEQVYSRLGLIWDPYDENKCWIHERDGDLKFHIFGDSSSNKIEITIHN